MADLDAEYLRLYREYADAIRKFDRALKRRREFRNRLVVKRTPVIQALNEWERRRNRQQWLERSAASLRPKQQSRVRGPTGTTSRPRSQSVKRIWMGPILGWAKLVPTPSREVDLGFDPDAYVDFDKSFDKVADEISLRMYWDVKIRYLEAKRAFFDYVRRGGIEVHSKRAREALDHAANLQWLGFENAEDEFEKAKEEVERACKNALKVFQSARSPKSLEMKLFLMGHLADAQLYGLDETSVAAEMTSALSDVFETYPAAGAK